MKILIYTPNFLPELTGSGKYNGELAVWFSRHGHQVDIITSYPHYPQWEILEKYKNKLWLIEYSSNMKVFRSPIYVPKRPSGVTRIIHEISFAITSLPYWIGAIFRTYDIVIAVCPPMQVGFFPLLYCKLKRIPFVFHIQDLQVDSAKTLGLIKNKAVLSFLTRLETFLLRNSDLVSSIGDGMKKVIIERGVVLEKYYMLFNWVDTDFIKPLPSNYSIRSKFGFKATDYVVLYSGNLGEKQGLECLLNVAKNMLNTKHVKFLISGDGATRESLKAQAENQKLSNVQFNNGVSYEDLPELLSIADLHLVIQRKGMANLVLPSKLTTTFAAGGMAIVTVELTSSLAKQLTMNDLAVIVPPEDSDSLESAIRELMVSSRPSIVRQNARRYAVEHFNQDIILSKFEKMLHNMIDFKIKN